MASGGKVLAAVMQPPPAHATQHQFAKYGEGSESSLPSGQNIDMAPNAAATTQTAVAEKKVTNMAKTPHAPASVADNWKETLNLLQAEVLSALSLVNKENVDVNVGKTVISRDRAAVVLSWNKLTQRLQSGAGDGNASWINGENGDNGLLLYLAIRFKEEAAKSVICATGIGTMAVETEGAQTEVVDVRAAAESATSNDVNNNSNDAQMDKVAAVSGGTDAQTDAEVVDVAKMHSETGSSVSATRNTGATGTEPVSSASSMALPPSPDDSGVGQEENDNHAPSESNVDDSSVSSKDSTDRKKPKKSVRWRERLEETSEDEAALKANKNKNADGTKAVGKDAAARPNKSPNPAPSKSSTRPAAAESRDTAPNTATTTQVPSPKPIEQVKKASVAVRQSRSAVTTRARSSSSTRRKPPSTNVEGCDESSRAISPASSQDSVVIPDVKLSSAAPRPQLETSLESESSSPALTAKVANPPTQESLDPPQISGIRPTTSRPRTLHLSNREHPPMTPNRHAAAAAVTTRRAMTARSRPTVSRSRSLDASSAQIVQRRRPRSTERPTISPAPQHAAAVYESDRSRSNSPSALMLPMSNKILNYGAPITILSSKPPEALAGRARLRERTLPDLRNVIRRLRSTHVPMRRTNLWFGPGKECEQSFNSRISDKVDLSELDEGSKHYFYFRSLPKVSPATAPTPAASPMKVRSVSASKHLQQGRQEHQQQGQQPPRETKEVQQTQNKHEQNEQQDKVQQNQEQVVQDVQEKPPELQEETS
jgi:hypothetical protein